MVINIEKLTFHKDAGHGWLEVPISKLKEIGIEREISEYSYMDRSKGLAYLEEDADMDLFYDKCLGILLVEKYSNISFIHNLERYKA